MIELDPDLIKAARAGNLAEVQRIINGWTDEDRRFGYTSYSPVMGLLVALEAGHEPVVNWLLEGKHVEGDAFKRLYPHTTVKLTDAQKAFLAAQGFSL